MFIQNGAQLETPKEISEFLYRSAIFCFGIEISNQIFALILFHQLLFLYNYIGCVLSAFLGLQNILTNTSWQGKCKVVFSIKDITTADYDTLVSENAINI